MKEIIHLVLKFNNSVYTVNTLEEHKNIIKNHSKVIWGVIKPKENSPGIAKRKIEMVKNQINKGNETYAYFSTHGEVKARGEIIDIINDKEEVLDNKILIPKYYHKDLNKCVAGVVLKNIEDIAPETINKLQRYGTEEGNVALSNQTNPLYVSIIKDKKAEKEKFKEAANTKEIKPENIKGYLEEILNYINSIGFIFEYEDLCNFYLSLKTKPFVLLAGISGTGKSKIIRAFADAIGANTNNNRFRMISVKPDWNDSTELFGYKNISDKFIPGIMTEIIKDALKNRNKPYIICIDEMNLARVEYYFSEFLSLIESRRRKGSEILTDKILNDNEIKESEYSYLYIPDNLYILGTVNMDDTTFSFSKKVLDRANTIEFSEVNLSKLFLENEYDEESGNFSLNNQFLKSNYINPQEIEEEFREYAEIINGELVEINRILKKANKHFAYRVREEILYYMVQNKKLNLLNEEHAFDFQIMQKILPALSGSQGSIKNVLIDLFNYCMGVESIHSDSRYLNEAEEVLNSVKYYRSGKKILSMMKGYEYDGFSTFWI